MLNSKTTNPSDSRLQQPSTEPIGWCSPEFSSGCMLEDDEE